MLPTVSQSSIKVAVGKDKQKNEEKNRVCTPNFQITDKM